MVSEQLPAELSGLVLARLGLPLLVFDSDETLVFFNSAATRAIPACRPSSTASSTHSLHARDVFESSANDALDFATAGMLSTAPVSGFSLDRLVADHADRTSLSNSTGTSAFSMDTSDDVMQEGWGEDQQQGAECRACLKAANDSTWWQASISSFFGSNDRSHYFCVLLMQAIRAPMLHQITPPEALSHGTSLERPPLRRNISDTVIGPETIDDCVDDSTLAAAIDPEFYKTAVESMSEILFISATSGIVTYLKYVSAVHKLFAEEC